MQKSELNVAIDNILNMIYFDKEAILNFSHHFKTPCCALKIGILDCGIWFTEHAAGVYGTAISHPLINHYWDANADVINSFLDNAVDFRDKAVFITKILIDFYLTIESALLDVEEPRLMERAG